MYGPAPDTALLKAPAHSRGYPFQTKKITAHCRSPFTNGAAFGRETDACPDFEEPDCRALAACMLAFVPSRFRQPCRKGTTQAIRDYAQLMVSSHVAVNNALDAVLRKKPAAPPPTLLKAAYSTMISSLEREAGKTFDSDYITGQVNYQNANAALYKYEIANGADLDLKAFAEQTLSKIEDHLQRALNLQGGAQER
jgi:predicted outer membrane protein